MYKTLLIRTNETVPYLQLGWWNIDNIPDLKGLKFIFAHNGAGICTGAYEIKEKSWINPKTGEYSDIIIPYSIKVDEIHKKDKNGNKIIKTVKRVNFFEYVNVREDLKTVKIPKTKQGQGYPLQVVNFENSKICIEKKFDRTDYDWSKNCKSGDIIWFYQLDSGFTVKNSTPVKMIIDDPINRSIIVNKIHFNSVNEYVKTALSTFIKTSNKTNKPRTMNSLMWIISDNSKLILDNLIKSDCTIITEPYKKLIKFVNEHSSYFLKDNFK